MGQEDCQRGAVRRVGLPTRCPQARFGEHLVRPSRKAGPHSLAFGAQRGVGTYLLFVDKSGTHAGSPAFVLGGAAVHEDDAQPLQERLDQLVIRHLGRIPPSLDEYELHAGEMRNAKRPAAKAPISARSSMWALVPRVDRLALLSDAYGVLADYSPVNPQLPLALFGVIVDAKFHNAERQMDRERFADEALTRLATASAGYPQERGRVVHTVPGMADYIPRQDHDN
jgi:hypothetical protein